MLPVVIEPLFLNTGHQEIYFFDSDPEKPTAASRPSIDNSTMPWDSGAMFWMSGMDYYDTQRDYGKSAEM